MDKLKNVEESNENNFLWPTISDAVDTFIRRRACDADSYERIWRAIHIWESVEITLALAALTRYGSLQVSEPAYQKCREYFYGMSWDQVNGGFKNSLGASDGSIDQWISILGEVAKVESPDSPFLKTLHYFLNQESINLSRIFEVWSRCCDISLEIRKKSEKIRTIQAMRHINSFRNRFAHVPFPHDPLTDLAQALEDTVEQLFSIRPLPSRHEDEKQSSPLTGCFDIKGHFLRGNSLFPASNNQTNIIQFMFPALNGTEVWQADDIIYADLMMRPHILTRIRDDQGTVEYTRFRAEVNAVITRFEDNIFNVIPKPKIADYEIEEEPPSSVNEACTLTQANEAIRKEDFDSSIEQFTKITQETPTYHVAWLRLGHAKREKAVRLSQEQSAEAIQLLKDATSDFTKATEHVNKDYQAAAYYERSKAYYQLYKRDGHDKTHLEGVVSDALQASELSSDAKYMSWLDFLDGLT